MSASTLPVLLPALPDLGGVLAVRDRLLSVIESSRRLLFLSTLSWLDFMSLLASSQELSARLLRLLEASWSVVLLMFFTNWSISFLEDRRALELLLRL